MNLDTTNKLKKTAKICLFLGIIFRLVWLGDMEWKLDQMLMYRFIEDYHTKGIFLTTGMKSGVGFPNFGASVWIFYLFGFFSNTPIGINIQVALFNCVGLLVLYQIINKYIKIQEQKYWWIAFSFFSISFLPVSLSRHLWAQNVLPPFTILLFYLYISRGRSIFLDFLLGFLIAFIGQIHMSGIFLGLVYFVFIVFFQIKSKVKIKIIPFLMGLFVSMALTLPYIYKAIYIPNFLKSGNASNFENFICFRPIWYTTFQGFGLDIFYHFQYFSFTFFKFPFLYITGIMFFVCGLIAIISILYSLFNINLFKNISFNLNTISNSITIQFCLISLISLFLISLTGTRLVGHYFMATYPFIFLIPAFFLSRLNSLKSIFLYISLQSLITISFLYFIHIHKGFNNCEYGKTYNSQIEK